jgi:preprotein translocase subunit YajC
MPFSLDNFAPCLFAAEPAQPNPFSFLWPLLAIGVIFYFLMIRPEKRRRAEITQMQGGLKKNDRVVTIGGIIGVVVNAQADSEEVTIRVDDSNNTRLHLLKSSISRVISADKTDDKADGA